MITCQDLANSLPRTNGKVSLKGLATAAQVYRDAYGIPHVRATSEPDAFFAQGFVTAQDRLWQMEYDRRRGSGRWAEIVSRVGPGAGPTDAPLPLGGQRPGRLRSG